nr:hypothetical protein [Brachybacterium sillae]
MGIDHSGWGDGQSGREHGTLVQQSEGLTELGCHGIEQHLGALAGSGPGEGRQLLHEHLTGQVQDQQGQVIGTDLQADTGDAARRHLDVGAGAPHGAVALGGPLADQSALDELTDDRGHRRPGETGLLRQAGT